MAGMPRGRLLQLGAIGVAAGLFSGLFGVGGGVVVVPLLILWLGYGEREATGTSLVAIVITAAAAVAVQAAYGNVRVSEALAIGLPAVGGVLAGTWLQQRIPGAGVRLLFAFFLAATAVLLVVRAL
jgi:uncharacterized membrane protein YfcA